MGVPFLCHKLYRLGFIAHAAFPNYLLFFRLLTLTYITRERPYIDNEQLLDFNSHQEMKGVCIKQNRKSKKLMRQFANSEGRKLKVKTKKARAMARTTRAESKT